MPKGHRRTQSSNLALSYSENQPAPAHNEAPVGTHEIVALLAKSNEKVE